MTITLNTPVYQNNQCSIKFTENLLMKDGSTVDPNMITFIPELR